MNCSNLIPSVRLPMLLLIGVSWVLPAHSQEPDLLPLTFPGAEWQSAEPEQVGLSRAGLETALAYLEPLVEDEGGLDRMMIIKNGYVVYAGSHAYEAGPTNCSSKAFTSTVTGMLMQNGHVSLTDHAANWAEFLQPDYSGITLKHFLTSTSGYDGVGGTYGQSLDGSLTHCDPAAPLFSPGTNFHYHDDAARVFGYVLTRVIEEQTAHANLHDFFAAKIGDKIGINLTRFHWDIIDHNGSPPREYPGELDCRDAVNGVQVAASEFARLAHLWLNDGKWRDQQILDPGYIDSARRPRVAVSVDWLNTDLNAGPWGDPVGTRRDRSLSRPGPGRYGYLWWTNGRNAAGEKLLPDCPEDLFWAQGGRGKRVFIFPDEGVIVIRLGDRNGAGSDPMVWNTFFRHLFNSADRAI